MAKRTGTRNDDTLLGTARDDVMLGLGGNDTLRGKQGNDLLRGGSGDDELYGGGGNDLLSGGYGNDRLYGDVGDDVITGGGGDDIIFLGIGNDRAYGGWGNDQFVVYSGRERVDGGDGLDILDFNPSEAGVTLRLGSGSGVVTFRVPHGPSQVRYTSIEGAFGSGYDDTLVGNGDVNEFYGGRGADTLRGNGGDDMLNGMQGHDRLLGGGGNDTLIASAGRDVLNGGKGADVIDLYYSIQPLDFDLARGRANLVFFEGAGVTRFSGIEDVYGTVLDDTIRGDGRVNTLFGREGDDTLNGNGGDDVLEGGIGDDTLFGGDGDDILVSDDGDDSLAGGAGRDAFFARSDRLADMSDAIEDFTLGEDIIVLDGGWFDFELLGVGPTTPFLYLYRQQLDPSQFQSGDGTVAANEDIRIIYDSATGILHHDANGSAEGGLTEIFRLQAGLDLTVESIFVF